MSVEIWEPTPPDETEFVIAHLLPIGLTSSMRLATDPVPFTLVNRAGGADERDFEDDSIVSVKHFDSTYTLAKQGANQRHQRMLLLKYTDVVVTMPDGTLASCDYLTVLQKPMRVDYGQEQIQTFISRYQIGFAPVS